MYRGLSVGVLYLLLLFTAGCSSPPNDPVKIGVVLPLSGPFQIYGEQGLKGAKLAVEQINAAGGVLDGRSLELIVRDNQTNPTLAVQQSRELIQTENVFALMGPVSSAARFAMSEVAEQHKTPLLYGIDYEGHHYNRYLINYSIVPEHYIWPVVPYLMKHSGKKYFIFGYDYIWPHHMAEEISRQVNKHGGEIKGVEFTPFDVTDYTPVFTRIKASGADNLMLILPGKDGFNFLNQMAAFDFERDIKTVAFAADETYLSQVEPEALEGVMTALHFFSSWSNPVFDKFVKEYGIKFGKDKPVTYASKSHYDLVYFLESAIKKAGSIEQEKVIDAFEDLTLYANEAEVRLRPDHHFDLPMFLAKFSVGELNVIETLNTVSPKDQRHKR